MRRFRVIGSGIALATMLSLSVSSVAAEEGFSPYVDDAGNISFPEGFRTSMVHLGSWYVPEGGASGFHDVYTEQETVEAFRKTGKFPDGATLVKELRAAAAGTYTTGQNVSYEPQAMMGYPLREESKVTVTVDGKNYVLFTKGDSAWVENAAEEPALVSAMRAGSTMTVKATSRRGTNTTYTFSLSGVTAALNEIQNCN